jgi:hypothetical protein
MTAFDRSVSFRAPIAKLDDLIIRANLVHIFQIGRGEFKGLFGTRSLRPAIAQSNCFYAVVYSRASLSLSDVFIDVRLASWAGIS